MVKGRKRHVLTDTLGLILFVVVCAASIADSDGAEYIFHETNGRFSRLHTILVDQGYKSWLVDFAKQWFGILVDIVKRLPGEREFVAQPQRWKIERTLGWLDWSRILSKEYERTTESSESNIYLASIRLLLRRLTFSPK
jgi:putative transposase